MKSELLDRPVGDIVSENYHAAGVFRSFGIDFCCGGHKTLQEVTQKKGIDPEEVTAKLEELSAVKNKAGENYSEWEPDFLIDYIINTHHRFVRDKSDEISAYAAKVAKVHGGSHPENIEIFKQFLTLADELFDHLDMEESVVFPLIKQVYGQQTQNGKADEKQLKELQKQLDLMKDDHEEAGGIMEEIAELSNRFTPPQDACATYRILYQNLEGFEQDLHKHVHLENNILFKKAEMLLSAQ